ncbi:hypothetical protein ILYODFUR_003868 [Ilyodon furcidens]|uniref:Uncharacterized protein n=1 Tax=Ilyodon furcidens TaxID=33524 RepID=A0ABV0UD52_9TELE
MEECALLLLRGHVRTYVQEKAESPLCTAPWIALRAPKSSSVAQIAVLQVYVSEIVTLRCTGQVDSALEGCIRPRQTEREAAKEAQGVVHPDPPTPNPAAPSYQAMHSKPKT